MDKKKIEGMRSDINALLSETVNILKAMETTAYEEREIDLMKPISNVRKNIQENKVRIIKDLDKLSKMKSNW
jgi:hypothetical protein